MKQKEIAIMACAAMLAACSDGIEDITPQQERLDENRPKAYVTISINDEIDNATRFVFGKTSSGYRWSFDDGDMMGIIGMDKENGSSTGSWNSYTFIDNARPSIPFTYNEKDNVFTNSKPIDEGNYFFYYPFDEKIFTGDYVGWMVNPNQNNYDPETGNYNIYQAYKDNQRYLGYKFIKGGMDTNSEATNISVSLVPIFSTYFFSFENNSTADFKAEKVILRNKDNTYLPASVILAPATMSASSIASQMNSASPYGYKGLSDNLWKYSLYQSSYGVLNKADNNRQIENETIDQLTRRGSTEIHYLLSLCDANNTLNSSSIISIMGTKEYSINFGNSCVIKNSRSSTKGYTLLSNIVMPNGTYNDMVVVLCGRAWDSTLNQGRGDWGNYVEIPFENAPFVLSPSKYGENQMKNFSFYDYDFK